MSYVLEMLVGVCIAAAMFAAFPFFIEVLLWVGVSNG